MRSWDTQKRAIHSPPAPYTVGAVNKLDEFVAEFRGLGDSGFRQTYNHPILIRRDSQGDDEAPEFNTGMIGRDALGQMLGGGPVGDQAGTIYPIVKRAGAPFAERIGVGRARNADVCLLLPKVSKYHAYFTADGDSFFLTDAGSKNGTVVAEKKLAPREPEELFNACEIVFGAYQFLFYTPTGFFELVQRRAQI